MMDRQKSLFITGFMGTGKTTVGRLVASKLERPFIDMDARIEAETGQTIAEIFSEQGEAAFRKLEADLCRRLANARGQVIATGGGTLLDVAVRIQVLESSTVYCLRCDQGEILRRLDRSEGRPLLDATNRDREIEITRLLAERDHAYAGVPWQVETSGRSPEEVAEEIVRLSRIRTSRVCAEPTPYSVYTGSGLRHRTGDLLRSITGRSSIPVCLVTNATVGDLYTADVARSLENAGFHVHVSVVPDGESAKTLATACDLYQEFVAAGLDRSGAVITLGGGVIGDLGGFAAATFHRGVQWLVHLPTTLLAMIDASIGGKTGVDLPQGKNLVGAFFHPSMVIADTQVLRTLPEPELRSGTAEALKHGIIASPDLFHKLGSLSLQGSDWAGDVGAEVIAQAQGVKIQLIEEDPLERGRRILLNLGHTAGHAIEAVSHYKVRHGDAVAAGLVASAHLAVAQGMASEALIEEITTTLEHLRLPSRIPPYSVDALLRAMETDKKRDGGHLRWVLPLSVGAADTATVPVRAVRQTLLALGAKENP